MTIILNGERYEIRNLGEQQLTSSYLRSDICHHFCDLVNQCGRFLYDAAVPCLLARDIPEEGTGFYFEKI